MNTIFHILFINTLYTSTTSPYLTSTTLIIKKISDVKSFLSKNTATVCLLESRNAKRTGKAFKMFFPGISLTNAKLC